MLGRGIPRDKLKWFVTRKNHDWLVHRRRHGHFRRLQKLRLGTLHCFQSKNILFSLKRWWKFRARFGCILFFQTLSNRFRDFLKRNVWDRSTPPGWDASGILASKQCFSGGPPPSGERGVWSEKVMKKGESTKKWAGGGRAGTLLQKPFYLYFYKHFVFYYYNMVNIFVW